MPYSTAHTTLCSVNTGKDVLSAMDGNCRPLHKVTSCNNAVLDTEVPPMMSKSARKTRKRGHSAAERHAGVKSLQHSLRLWKKRSSVSSSTASSSFSLRTTCTAFMCGIAFLMRRVAFALTIAKGCGAQQVTSGRRSLTLSLIQLTDTRQAW